MKKQLPKPAPEQAPQRAVDRARRISKLQEKQLVAGTAELGDRLNKALMRLADACAPVDEIIPGQDIYTPESRDAVSTALALGRFAEELTQPATAAIQQLTRENHQGIKEIAFREKQTDRQPNKRETEREHDRRNERVNRFLTKRNVALLTMKRVADAQHRPLFAALVLEISNAGIADHIVSTIAEAKPNHLPLDPAGSNSHEFEQLMLGVSNELSSDDPASSRRRFFPWVALAYDTYLDKCKIKRDEDSLGQLRLDNVREWLQTVDLQSTGQKPHVIPLDDIQFLGKKLLLRIHVPDDLHAFSIAGFDIIFADRANDDGAVIAGEFSRLTADITTHGMWVYSPRRAMELFGASTLYDKIRFEVIRAVYQQYEQEQLPEEDRLALRELLSENPSTLQKAVAETPPPVAPVTAADTTTTAPKLPPGSAASTTPTSPTPIDFDTFGEMGTGRKRRLRETRERDATYKMGVMAVKKRFLRLPDIRFSTKTGDHGHFYGPKGKVRFYNEHRAERMLTLSDIEDKLTQLGYDLDQFWNV